MNIKNVSKTIGALFGAAITILAAPTSHAGASYHVTINTTSLISDPGAPFALDFVLTGGNALANYATLSNFVFSIGGSPTANPPATTFGLASGSLSTTVSLGDNAANFFNEFYQGFIPASTLEFDLGLTTNLNGPTPDGLSVAILDQNLQNSATNGPGDSLMLININSTTPVAQTFSSTNGVTVSVVPEPSSALLCGSVLVGACGLVRRRRA